MNNVQKPKVISGGGSIPKYRVIDLARLFDMSFDEKASHADEILRSRRTPNLRLRAIIKGCAGNDDGIVQYFRKGVIEKWG